MRWNLPTRDAAASLSPSLKSAAPKPLCAENRMRV